jgi:hypothetical protein
MIDHLAFAFGGMSQVPAEVVGRALMGRVNNGDLVGASPETVNAECDKAIEAILGPDLAGDDGYFEEIKSFVLRGMDNQTGGMPDCNPARAMARTLRMARAAGVRRSAQG